MEAITALTVDSAKAAVNGKGPPHTIEVKGGTSKIGDRIINDIEGVKKGSIAEQGTLPYLKQILFEMGKREATKKLARDLADAVDRGRVDYFRFKQGFDDLGNLKSPEVNQYDIREKGSNIAK